MLHIEDIGLINYQDAYERQMTCVKQVINGESDHLFLCEHPTVFTLGRMFTDDSLLHTKEFYQSQGYDVVQIDRGGDITLHAPGQLVAYPILNLKNYRQDLRWYLRKIEEVVVALLSDFDILATGNEDQRGVWVDENKIASMGISVKRWVTYHGLGVNISTDLNLFKLIRPCGLDVNMTSLEQIKNKAISMDDVKEKFVKHFVRTFDMKEEENDSD